LKEIHSLKGLSIIYLGVVSSLGELYKLYVVWLKLLILLIHQIDSSKGLSRQIIVPNNEKNEKIKK